MSDSTTRSSLFVLLKQNPRDEKALKEFVDRYGPRIFAWARARALKPEDAEDVMQEVLARLLKALQRFEYDRNQSFRGFVCVVTQNAVNDLLAERRRRPEWNGSDAIADQLARVEARDELCRRLEEEYDREVFEEACRQVQLLVTPLVWRRFWLTVPEGLGGRGLPLAEAAVQERVPTARIHQARYLAIARLKEQIRRLGGNNDVL